MPMMAELYTRSTFVPRQISNRKSVIAPHRDIPWRVPRKCPSVPIPKFANTRGTLSRELRNQRDTSNSMILVPLLNPKFAIGLAA
jgi:hypothetical protein